MGDDEEENGVSSASSEDNWLDAQALSVDYIATAHSDGEEGRQRKGGGAGESWGPDRGGGEVGGGGSPFTTEATAGVGQGLSLDYEDETRH